jgi:DNA-binding PadR family transcriptional regulator
VARLLEPTLLLLLHHAPNHGYTLINELADYGLDEVDASAVYRALRTMEEREWVVSDWDEAQTQVPPRRVSHPTELGGEVLRWWTRDLNETRRLINHVLGTYQEHMETGKGNHH